MHIEVRPVTQAKLDTQCSVDLAHLRSDEAFDAVCTLGRLARWWLHDRVCELATDYRGCPRDVAAFLRDKPRLPRGKGCCWAVFARDEAESSPLPLLRPAFLLPLKWKNAKTHSRQLPPALVDIAEGVRQALGNERHERNGDSRWNGWTLHPADCVADRDLSGLALSCDSAWASLVVGVMACAEGGRPEPEIWASGAWQVDSGIRRVEQLDAKLRLAQEFRVRSFFVPESQLDEARNMAARFDGLTLEIGGLKCGTTRPHEALRALRQAFKIPAGVDDVFEDRCAEYFSRHDDGDAEQYYRDNLLEEVARGCKARLSEQASPPGNLKYLVTIADNVNLVALVIMTFHPSHCLLLHTREKTPAAEQTRDVLKTAARNTKVRLCAFDPESDLREELSQKVGQFIQGTMAAEVAFDMTPGTKPMTLALAMGVARPGNLLIYLKHDRRGRRVRPGSEQFVVWNVESKPIAHV